MIRHQVYFDTLGSMKEDSASWRSVFAGLSVLRLVDAYVEAGSGAPAVNWAQVHSVRAALENVAEGDPVRGVLTNLVEELTSRQGIDDAVCVAILAYGRALDYEANWALAADVFSSVTKLVRPEKNARLAVEANVAVGGAARRNGDWELSGRAYSQAAYIADTLGDRQGVLTVQVGIANTYLAKGNIPQAESILDDVIVQARDQEMPEVEGMALHSRAAVSQRRGKISEGIKLAHDALNLTRKPSERDQVLEDIAAMFTDLGMYEPARDAHLIVVGTAQSKFVRWTATLNLMELSGIVGDYDAFNAYARELIAAPLGSWVKAHFLLFFGEGLQRFGRADEAEPVLRDAISFAESHEYHQVVFKSQEVLAAVRAAPRVTTRPAAPAWTEQEVAPVARALSDLLKTSVAAA